MEKTFFLLILFGSLHLIFALFLAWVMIGKLHFRNFYFFKSVKSYGDLVKAHIDYLLMSLFLLIFFEVYMSLKLVPHILPVSLAIYGATVNPLGFLIPAFFPKTAKFSTVYRIFLYSGHVATTVGFCWIAIEWILFCLKL